MFNVNNLNSFGMLLAFCLPSRPACGRECNVEREGTVGVMVMGSALLEMFAVFQMLHGSEGFLWRLGALLLPLMVFFLLLRSRSAMVLAPESAAEDDDGAGTTPVSDLDRKLSALKDCPSVANKVAAADELMRCGRFDDAVPLYQSALSGIYHNEPDFLFKLAQAQIEASQTGAASQTLDRLTRDHERYRPEETRLLHARMLEGQGRVRAALDEYESLTSAYVGLEAKCRFGLLLMREGQIERAHAVFMQMVRDAEHSDYARRAEHHWLRVASHCQARLQSKLAPNPNGAR